MQAQPLEGVAEHQLGRLGAQAAAPGVALADGDVEQDRAVVGVQRAERGEADQPPVGQLDDGVGERVGRQHPELEEALDLARVHRAAPGSASAARPPGRGTSARRRAGRPAAAGAARPGGRRSAAGATGRGRRTVARCMASLTRAIVYRRDPDVARGPGRPDQGYHRAIEPMRRWSEVAARIAATSRTTEKVATLAEYLRSLDARGAAARGHVPDRSPLPRTRPAHDGYRLVGDRRGGRGRSRAPDPGRWARPTTSRPTSARRSATCSPSTSTNPPATPPTLLDADAAFAAIAAARGAGQGRRHCARCWRAAIR